MIRVHVAIIPYGIVNLFVPVLFPNLYQVKLRGK